jgi:hypothetical protein
VATARFGIDWGAGFLKPAESADSDGSRPGIPT